ncbi:MAG: cytochrome c3 family protein [Desulfobulbales bacterium]|nr:cytochrome c3 family protein [Desulfobulbales bacterium]
MHEKGKLFIRCLIMGFMLVSSTQVAAMDGPDFIELETLVNIYDSVAFDHAMHSDVASCATCHHHTTGLPAEDESCLRCHKESNEADVVTCAGCHPANQGRAMLVIDAGLYHMDRTGLKRAYHLNCLGCHTEMDGPRGCDECHAKRDNCCNMESADN